LRRVLDELLCTIIFGTGFDRLRRLTARAAPNPAKGNIPTFFEKSGRAGGDLILPGFAETAGANKKDNNILD